MTQTKKKVFKHLKLIKRQTEKNKREWKRRQALRWTTTLCWEFLILLTYLFPILYLHPILLLMNNHHQNSNNNNNKYRKLRQQGLFLKLRGVPSVRQRIHLYIGGRIKERQRISRSYPSLKISKLSSLELLYAKLHITILLGLRINLLLITCLCVQQVPSLK